MDYARTLDLADRYLNSKSSVYHLRANRVEQAERTIALFARHDSKDPAADPLGNIKDMQVLWFEVEAAAASERLGDFGPALKRYLRIVDKHFVDFDEDAFDFHMYCLRKSTLGAYADMMLTEQKLRAHATFLRAAVGAARCYFALHLDPAARKAGRQSGAGSGGAAGGDGAAAAAKPEPAKPAAAAAAASAVVAVDDDGHRIEKDDDPHGDKLVAGDAPLEAAHKYVRLAADNLPAVYRTAAAADAAAAAAQTKQEVPAGGSAITPATSASSRRHASWNISAEAAVEVHALAADVELARGRALQAAAHVVAAQAAAADTVEAKLAAGTAAGAGLAAHHGHPLALAAAARLFRAAEGASGGAAAAALQPIVASPQQRGKAGSAAEFVSAARAALGSAGLRHARVLLQLQLEAAGLPVLPSGLSPAVRWPAAAGGAAQPSAGSDAASAASTAKAIVPATVRQAGELHACLSKAAAAGWLGPSGSAAADAARASLEARFPAADALAQTQ
jgi:hypothetical protein